MADEIHTPESSPQPSYTAPGQDQLPAVYFNGFDLNSSLSDMGSVLLFNGKPQLLISMSFTTAKTLAKELDKLVTAFEKATAHEVMVMEDVRAAYERNPSPPEV